MVASLGQRSRPGPCQLQRFVRVDWSDGQSYGACYGKPAFAYVFKKIADYTALPFQCFYTG